MKLRIESKNDVKVRNYSYGKGRLFLRYPWLIPCLGVGPEGKMRL